MSSWARRGVREELKIPLKKSPPFLGGKGKKKDNTKTCKRNA